MAKQKIEKEFIYEGLGFPIILRNVPMIELRGIWTLDLDLNVLQKVVLLALAHHPTDLTGNQVQYIRSWLNMTQVEFGNLFGVTHPAVVKWEKAGDKASKINLTTQRDLRLLLLDKLLSKDEDFRKAFRIVHITKFSREINLLEFDVPIDLVAI
jgi:DNA-binding transcriptional regulator YiaG